MHMARSAATASPNWACPIPAAYDLSQIREISNASLILNWSLLSAHRPSAAVPPGALPTLSECGPGCSFHARMKFPSSTAI